VGEISLIFDVVKTLKSTHLVEYIKLSRLTTENIRDINENGSICKGNLSISPIYYSFLMS
jgi:hypothetical protein